MSYRQFIVAVCASALLLCHAPLRAEESDDAEDAVEAEEIQDTAVEVDADDDADDASEDEHVEQVIVTGSLIRRGSFDIPSPTTVIDEVDLEFAATTDLGDVIFDQTYQVGVNANAAPFEFGAGDDQGATQLQGVEVFPNLRGLGARATMTMMDGHRVPTNVTGYSFWTRRAGADVSNLYPEIAIARVETILDGASALYGSEAVSGVVNVIPQKRYDGLRVRYSLQQPVEDGAPQKTFGLLAGAQGERTSSVFALEIRDTARMNATDRPDFIVSSTGWTGMPLPTYGEWDHSSPGSWRVPHRTATGEFETPPLAGWTNYPERDAPPGWTSNSGPWFLYPSVPGANDYLLTAPQDPQYIRTPEEHPDHPGLLGRSGGQKILQTPDGRHVFVVSGYSTTRGDASGQFRVVPRMDPGCWYPFGGGNDQLGTAADANDFGLSYNDVAKAGNFLNGYYTGNLRGVETRTLGEFNSHGSHETCRGVFSDWQDIQAKGNKESAYGYFNHQFNDYVSVHGEVVASTQEYSTHERAYRIDEWNEGTTRYGPDVAIAIGSNPGNPYRAFADGSNTCDYVPNLPGCDEFGATDAVPTVTGSRALIWRADLEHAATNPEPGVFQGDTFMSWIDANGDGIYNYMQEAGELLLYAQDANGDGLPDRDLNGDGVADEAELGNVFAQKDPSYRVLLLPIDVDTDGDGVPDRFDPDMHRAGGVRLFEDVRMANLSPHPKNPYVRESYPWLNEDMSFDRRNHINSIRLRLGTSIDIMESGWVADLDWIWQRADRENDYLEPVWTWTVASLRCQGGSPQSSVSPNECWNPFSTAWLASDPETGQILPAWRAKPEAGDNCDPAAGEVAASCAWNTELENRRAGLVKRQDKRVNTTNIIDAVIGTNRLFNLWYNDNPVGFAVGVHYRSEREQQRPNQYGNSTLGSARQTEQQTQEETRAIFAEVQLFPLPESWGELEVQAAVRYAEFIGTASFARAGAESRFDVTIPKLAMRWQPFNLEWLALRASRTEGFVLPGMFQLFNSADYRDTNGSVVDYLCNLAPDLAHCVEANPATGSVSDVLIFSNAPNENLSAEISELWNAGISLRFLDGDLNMDLDYTTVEFNGRVERIGPGGVVNAAGLAFESFVIERCGDTLLDYNNLTKYPTDEYPDIPRNVNDFINQTSPEELACRNQAAREFVEAVEQPTSGALIKRDDTLRLTQVSDSWYNQGAQKTTTLIFNSSYSFDGPKLPLLGDDYGRFQVGLQATHMLELSLQRYSVGSGHVFEGITVDGVGNRNTTSSGDSTTGWFAGGNLYTPLPATPEWRVNWYLRWFRDSHSAQLGVRWHDELTDIHAGWDELLEATAACREGRADPNSIFCRQSSVTSTTDFNGPLPNLLHGESTEGFTEADACADQDRNPYCRIDSRAYWDFSYTYNKPDVFGFGYLSLNVAMRNIFDTYPDPMPSGAGYEGYVDNIMGRTAFMRLELGF